MAVPPQQSIRRHERERWEGGAGSRWTSPLQLKKKRRRMKREELWRQGEREVG